jgi:hypothetical protein
MELWNYDFSMTTKWGILEHISDRSGKPYLGNAEYPRGLVGGIARSEHFFSPHFEHRIRFSTSTRRASQPHNRPSVCGSAVRSWPHAEHVKTKVYWPNSSLNLSIRNSRAIGADCYEMRPARPSSTSDHGSTVRDGRERRDRMDRAGYPISVLASRAGGTASANRHPPIDPK